MTIKSPSSNRLEARIAARRMDGGSEIAIRQPKGISDREWLRHVDQLSKWWAQELAWLTYEPVVAR